MGTLFYRDDIDILGRYVDEESVDLVYLDPPFNNTQNYNAFSGRTHCTGDPLEKTHVYAIRPPLPSLR
jgi:16S rRNA G966 N2-methylase RsmD